MFQLFHEGGLYHIEICSLICRANQWTGFYMIGTSATKESKIYLADMRGSSKNNPAFVQCSQVILEPSRTSMMKLFRKNSKRFWLFSRKNSIADVRLGSKYASSAGQKNYLNFVLKFLVFVHQIMTIKRFMIWQCCFKFLTTVLFRKIVDRSPS